MVLNKFQNGLGFWIWPKFELELPGQIWKHPLFCISSFGNLYFAEQEGMFGISVRVSSLNINAKISEW